MLDRYRFFTLSGLSSQSGFGRGAEIRRDRHCQKGGGMPQLPMFPSWEGIHPLITHFPIALFFLAPLFLLLAVFAQADKRSTFLASALIVMVLGTGAMYIAYEAGKAAATVMERTGGIEAIVEHHQKLAGYARSSLTLATILFGLGLLICRVSHVRASELAALVPVGFLTFYGLGLFWLLSAAYNGERLVHEFGVRGFVAP
jgi:uncharacterized membrane protein